MEGNGVICYNLRTRGAQDLGICFSRFFSCNTLSEKKGKKIRFVKCYNRVYAEDLSGSSPKSFRENKN